MRREGGRETTSNDKKSINNDPTLGRSSRVSDVHLNRQTAEAGEAGEAVTGSQLETRFPTRGVKEHVV